MHGPPVARVRVVPPRLRYPSDHEPAIDVRPAVGRFDDFATVVGTQRPDAAGCWCMSYRDSRIAALDRPQYMREQCSDQPGPGVLVYVDDVVAGWCSIAPRASYRRLLNSRTIPAPDGDLDTWCAVCFVVRSGFRRHGLISHLLAGAVDHARSFGADAVEGYPADVGEERVDVISGYVGTVAVFERNGFSRASATSSRSGGQSRVVMRRTF